MIRMKNPAGLQSTVLSLPRGKFLGKRLGDPPTSEADHFIRRLEHAGDGWRPFAVPQAAALHLWRAVSSGLSYMPHSAHWSCSVPKSYFLIFNF